MSDDKTKLRNAAAVSAIGTLSLFTDAVERALGEGRSFEVEAAEESFRLTLSPRKSDYPPCAII